MEISWVAGDFPGFDKDMTRFNAWKFRSDKSQNTVQFPSREGNRTQKNLARVWILLV